MGGEIERGRAVIGSRDSGRNGDCSCGSSHGNGPVGWGDLPVMSGWR